MTRLNPLAPMLIGMYMVWRLFLNPYVSFGQDRLRVNNVFTYSLVPYHLITALEGRTALTLAVSGYGRLSVAALDARSAAVPRAGHGFEKRSTLGLPEWLGPVTSLALFLVGGFASSSRTEAEVIRAASSEDRVAGCRLIWQDADLLLRRVATAVPQ